MPLKKLNCQLIDIRCKSSRFKVKLKKLGKKYNLSQGRITNQYDRTDIKKNVLNDIDTVLEYVLSIEKFEPHSVYLRGSCLEESESALDMDLIILHDENFDQVGNYGYELLNGHWSYTDHSKELISRVNIFVDISFMSVKEFTKDIETRFLSKKVYGDDLDLSMSELCVKDIVLYPELPQNHRNLPALKRMLYGEVTADQNLLNRVMKGYIQDFYRDFGLISLIRNNAYSNSIYHCHHALLNDMPYLREKLEFVLDVFLNTDAYSKRSLRSLIHDMSHLAEECNHITHKEKV